MIRQCDFTSALFQLVCSLASALKMFTSEAHDRPNRHWML